MTLNSLEGIATFLVLILHSVQSAGDIVDTLESSLKGKFWLIGNPHIDGSQGQHEFILRSFAATAVMGADRDSPQRNQTRLLMSELVMHVGRADLLDSNYIDSISTSDILLY